jgi:hypothetical protein
MQRDPGSEDSASPAPIEWRPAVKYRSSRFDGHRRESPRAPLMRKQNLSMYLHRHLTQNGTDMCKMANKMRTNVSTWVILYRFGLPNLEVIAYTWVCYQGIPRKSRPS